MTKNMLVRRALPIILLLSLALSLVGNFFMPVPVVRASNSVISLSVGNISEPPSYEYITGKTSTIGTSTTANSWATTDQFQRKLLVMAGRLWIFYNDGSNYVWKTSTDNGSTWSGTTTLKAGSGGGHALGIAYDGTYLHYGFALSNVGAHLYYRMGTPNTDNTITWVTAEQDLGSPGATGDFKYPNLVIDTNGDPWIGVAHNTNTDTTFAGEIWKSSTHNGTWTNDTGFPYTVRSGGTSIEAVPVGVALTGAKTYWIWSADNYTSQPLNGKLWNGSWGSTENATGRNTGYTNWATVADGDNVHIAYYEWGTPSLAYYKRTYGVGWADDFTISTADAGQATAVSIFGTDSFVAFWHNADGYVRYRTKTSGSWDTANNTWINETSDTLATSLNFQCTPVATSSAIGFVYVTKATAPYNVKFASLVSQGTGATTTTYSPSGNSGYWVDPANAYSADEQYAYRNVSTNNTNNATANTGAGWTNPTNAYQTGGSVATQTSGSGNNTYGTYGFNITSGSIYKVRVRTDAYSTGGVAANQTKTAANDISNTGTFITAPLFSKINDNNDSTLITGQTNGGGHATFTASTNFTIPTGSTIVDVAVHYRHRSNTTGTAANSGTVLKVGGTYYGLSGTLGTYTDNGTSSEPASGSAIADRIYYWTRNPKTDLAWVANDVNDGAGAANPLQEWGVGGTDFNPDVNFYQCDIWVDYTTSSSDDLIRVRVSGDGGTNWSSAQNSTLTSSLASYYFDFTSATTWTANTVNNTNLKVAVDSVTVGDTSTISLDWIPVEVMSFVASNLTQTYNTYGISLTGTDTITKVEVGTEAYATSSENLSIEVSPDAGASWSSNQTTPSFGTTDPNTTTWYDFTSATAWTADKLNNTNFQTRITYVDNGSHGQINLDWLPVRITYTSGAASVNNTPSSINYGVIRFSRTYWSKTGNTTAPSFPLGDADCKFLLTNDSTITENISVQVTGNFTGIGANWTIVSTAPATDEARLYAYASGAADNTSGVLLSGTPQSFVTNLASSGTKYWEIRLDSGSSFSDGYQKTNTVRITASSP